MAKKSADRVIPPPMLDLIFVRCARGDILRGDGCAGLA